MCNQVINKAANSAMEIFKATGKNLPIAAMEAAKAYSIESSLIMQELRHRAKAKKTSQKKLYLRRISYVN